MSDTEDLKQLLSDLILKKNLADSIQGATSELEGRFIKVGFEEQTKGIFFRIRLNTSLVQDEFLALYRVLNGIVEELEKKGD